LLIRALQCQESLSDANKNKPFADREDSKLALSVFESLNTIPELLNYEYKDGQPPGKHGVPLTLDAAGKPVPATGQGRKASRHLAQLQKRLEKLTQLAREIIIHLG